MNYKENYKKLLLELEALGGRVNALRGVSNFYSLENEAKVRLEIKRLKVLKNSYLEAPKSEEIPSENKKETPKNENTDERLGMRIVDFPPELHSVFWTKKHTFLQACSLKMQLNAIPVENESEALEIQLKIARLFEKMDEFDVILNFWTLNKQILKPKRHDFSSLSPLELIKKRNVLRSNLVSREKSLEKWKKQAETLGENASLTLKSKILRKSEEIEQLKLTINELDNLIK